MEPSLRERLVDAGVDLVTTEGVGALGLREIARRAGVSHGAPRRYFPTHQSLLSAIARRGFAELADRFATATTGPTEPRDQLRALSRAYLGYARDRRGMFELMFRHDLLDGANSGTSQPPLRESTLPLFQRVVTLVARTGSPAPERTAALLWANLHGLAQLWLWHSLPLALSTPPPTTGHLDALVDAAVDAHLGAVTR